MQLQIDFTKALPARPSIVDGLNNNQLKAVTHKNGPLLIIAGAGTGKTTVLTRRIAHIIEQKWAKPSEILALTFTEKAAAEMEERVDLLVPYGFVDTQISTFHAFGDQILRDYALDLGLPAHFRILTEAEQIIFMQDNLFSFDLKYFRPLSNPTSHITALLKHFSRLKDELIAPIDYVNWAQDQISNISVKSRSASGEKNQNDKSKIEKEAALLENEKLIELANAYQRYCELMLQAGNLDFGDLIFLTYNLLNKNKSILSELQNKYKYILIDEYQDTNYAQNEIVKLLAAKHKNITVVGDDDQAIYRFRGASISNILDFKKTYPRARQIVLIDNYRSTQEILDAAYKLIQHNNPDRLEAQNNINKRLIGHKHGSGIKLSVLETISTEADFITREIVKLKNKNCFYRDFAILIRANSQAIPFMQALNTAGIPYVFSGASNLFESPEIQMLISFLRCLIDRLDNINVFSLATSELYDIPPQKISEIFVQAKRSNRSVTSIIENDHSLIGNDQKLVELANDLREYSLKMKQINAGELLYDFLSSKGYLKNLIQNPSIENELKIKNIAKFFDRIAQFNNAAQNKSVAAFVEKLQLLLEAGDEIAASGIDSDIDAVNILTVHAAKGLEWRSVFIANLVADRFPNRKRREPLPIHEELIKERLPRGDYHLEEERRLFYVAATRAKELLYLTSAQDCGGKRKKKLSPFVMEMLDKPEPQLIRIKLSDTERIDRFKKLDALLTPLPYKFSAPQIRLSRLQIDDYHTCPKKFYYAHIVRIPLLENHNLMYGTAIHAALNRHLSRKMRREKSSLNQLLLDFQQTFRNVGFISVEHEKRRYEGGVETLKQFFAADQNEKTVPASLEKPFEFSLESAAVIGRYDAIYGGDREVEIRDFKTSDVRTQEDADRRVKESTQMMIYALSWHEKYQNIPKTTLHFIESGLKGSITFDPDVLKATKKIIADAITGIRQNNMAAKPDYFACMYCPFKDICPDSISG